jgi:hypothetical protein
MSFVIAAPEYVAATATDLANNGTQLTGKAGAGGTGGKLLGAHGPAGIVLP